MLAVVVVLLAVSAVLAAPGRSRSWQTHSAGEAGPNLIVVVAGNLGVVVLGIPLAVVGMRVIAGAGSRSAAAAESRLVVDDAAAAAENL